MQFPKSDPVYVLPLGVERPEEFGNSEDLLTYLRAKADAWLDISKQGDARGNLEDVIIDNIEKINDNVKTVMFVTEDMIAATAKTRAQEIQKALSNAERAWIDPSGLRSRRYMGLAKEGATASALQGEFTRLQKLRESALKEHLTAKASSNLEDDPKGPSGKPRRILLSDEESADIAAEARANFEALVSEAKQEFRRSLASDITEAEARFRHEIQAASEKLEAKELQLETLHDVTRTYESSVARLREQVANFERSLAVIAEKLAKASDDSTDKVAALNAELNAKLVATAASVDQSLADLRSKLGEAAVSVEEAKRKTSDDLDAFKARYEEKSRLYLPTDYWSKKASWHAWISAAALVVFVGTIGAAFWQSIVHFPTIWEHLKDLQAHNSGGLLNLTGLAVITVPAVAFFWILKHISRVFLDNVAQANDAGQRRVMMQTYLALVGDPTAKVSEQERLLVLNALFRPSATGGSDDAPPSNLLEILTKLGDGKKDSK